MKIPVTITYQHVEPRQGVEASIDRWVQRLESFRDHLLGVRVRIERTRRWTRGPHFRVAMDLVVADGEIPIGHGAGEQHVQGDLHVAIGDAFRDARRVLLHAHEPRR